MKEAIEESGRTVAIVGPTGAGKTRFVEYMSWRLHNREGRGHAEGVPLARCAFVGDRGHAVWLARAAGFPLALHPTSDELEREADAVVRSAR